MTILFPSRNIYKRLQITFWHIITEDSNPAQTLAAGVGKFVGTRYNIFVLTNNVFND